MLPGPDVAQRFSEDLDRMAERGLAKLNSTFSNLRQKAQQAIRNHEGASRLFQSQSAYDVYVPPSGAGWSPMNYMRRNPYDNDPRVLSDAELETLAHEPSVPSKDLPDPAPQLPKRPDVREEEPANKGKAKEIEEKPTEQSTEAIPEQRIYGKDDKSKAKHEIDAADKAPPEAKATAVQSVPDGKARDQPSQHRPSPDDKGKTSDADDEEFIDNPFDDDD